MEDTLAVCGFYLLRVPTLAMDTVLELNRLNAPELVERLKELLDNKLIREALFQASPTLVYEIEKCRSAGLPVSDKIAKTVYKYIVRMCTRATPYGLFAGVSPGRILEGAEDSMITLKGTIEVTHRLDMQCAAGLGNSIAGDLGSRSRIMFSLNPTIYQQGDFYKFYQYRIEDGEKIHFLSSVRATTNLAFVLEKSKGGIPYQDLVKAFTEKGAKTAEAREFLDKLIANQLLLSELEPTLTGDNYLNRLEKKLQTADNQSKWALNISKINEVLNNEANIINMYDRVSGIIQKLTPGSSYKHLIQSDTIVHAEVNQIGQAVSKQIASQLNDLLVLDTSELPVNLRSFRERFMDRYDRQEIPLLEVLDPDTGIGYGAHPADYRKNDGLLNGLKLSSPSKNGENSGPFYQSIILDRFLETRERQESEMVLNAQDLEKIGSLRMAKPTLPATCYALGNLLKNKCTGLSNGPTMFHLQGCVGASGSTLISRFGHLSATLTDHMKQLCKHEQSAYPHALVAEIIHLPEARVGNVLQRPSLRSYEIPILTAAGDDALSINPSDLMVSVKSGRIILRSKKLGKEVIPRLTTAHNYHNSINLYRFLADLQYQDDRFSIKWDWGLLQERAYLPRVRYKEIILSRETWNIDPAAFFENFGSLDERTVKHFLERYKLPRQVLLSEGDNELLIDLGNQLSRNILFDRLKKGRIKLHEFLFSEYDSVVKDRYRKTYANELVLPFRTAKRYQAATEQPLTTALSRSISLGGEWVYAKIFCGQRQADQLIQEQVHNIIDTLKNKGLLKKWFFVRYNENGHHIRLRILREPHASLEEIIQVIHDSIQPLIDCREIPKIEFDTYVRELERYTPEHMELSETLFFLDSDFVSNIIGQVGRNDRWLLGVYGVAQLLKTAGLDMKAQQAFSEKMRAAYFLEFRGDKQLDRQLNLLFRQGKKDIEQVFSERYLLTQSLHFVEQWKQQLTEIFETLLYTSDTSEKVLHTLLSSYAHMFINRLFASDQRLHELVTYHFLCKYYLMLIGKTKAVRTY